MERSGELAFVAHEMNGALAPACHALEIVRSGGAGPVAADQERLLAIAARGLERAQRVLQNVTAMVAPQTYAVRCDEVDAETLLRGICESYAAEARARRVHLQHEIEAVARFPADPFCVEQVLVNLVSNAVKFTPAGGHVTVRAESLRAAVLPGRLTLLGGGFGCEPHFVRLEVRDTGIGVSDESRRRLFEPFYRGPEAERCGAPGLRLGLTVARRLAELLHGHLRLAAARPGTGSRFLLTLAADAATWQLLVNIDAALAALGSRLAAAPQAILVLRHPHDVTAFLPPNPDTELVRLLHESTATVLPLSRTTAVLCGTVPVRLLVHAVSTLVERTAGASERAALRMHVQRVPRGAVADERLLQGVVRCRHILPASAAREVLDASDSARR